MISVMEEHRQCWRCLHWRANTTLHLGGWLCLLCWQLVRGEEERREE